MAQCARRAVASLVLLVLAACILGPALDHELELPGPHFDGDGDDSAHVQAFNVHWVDTSVTDALRFVPMAPVRHRPLQDGPLPEQVVLEPHGSRAPPG